MTTKLNKITPEMIKDIKDEEYSFGTTKYLPKRSTLPDEFRRHDGTKWNKIFSNAFFFGWEKIGVKLEIKPAIAKECSSNEIMKFLYAHMRSFSPKQEDKEAGVAWLMSQIFKDFKEKKK